MAFSYTLYLIMANKKKPVKRRKAKARAPQPKAGEYWWAMHKGTRGNQIVEICYYSDPLKIWMLGADESDLGSDWAFLKRIPPYRVSRG